MVQGCQSIADPAPRGEHLSIQELPDKVTKLSSLDRSFECISLASIYKGMGVICIQVTWDSGHA